jgi:hypothetical protein
VVGASARIDTTRRGKPVSLYTGDQTRTKRTTPDGERPAQAGGVRPIH